MNGSPADSRWRVRFNPEINIGHVLQLVFAVATVIGAYVAIRTDIETTRGEFKVAMATMDGRVKVVEQEISNLQLSERETMSEFRATLGEMQRAVSDLRVLLAEQKKPK